MRLRYRINGHLLTRAHVEGTVSAAGRGTLKLSGLTLADAAAVGLTQPDGEPAPAGEIPYTFYWEVLRDGRWAPSTMAIMWLDTIEWGGIYTFTTNGPEGDDDPWMLEVTSVSDTMVTVLYTARSGPGPAGDGEPIPVYVSGIPATARPVAFQGTIVGFMDVEARTGDLITPRWT